MVKRIKDKNAPKRPLTGFLLFGNYLRSTDENIKAMSVTQQATTIGNMWKKLDENAKQKYNDESEKLKAQYKKDLSEYEKTDSYKDFQNTLVENKTEKKKATRKRVGPTKMSGYRLFMKENKDVLDEGLSEEDVNMKHIAKCGLQWKRLSEEERLAYNDRAAKMSPEKAEVSQEKSSEDGE